MFDHQPFLLCGFAAADFDQHKTSSQFVAVQNKFEFAAIDLLLRRLIAFCFEGAVVPDDYVAGAIISLGYFTLELGVLERVIFSLNSEAFIARIHRRAFGDGPGLHHAIHFQPEIVMQAPRVMLLNDELRAAMGWAPADEVEEVLNKHLASRKYFLGDDFSAVDIMLGGGAHFMLMAKMIKDTPVMKAYTARVVDRPAFRKMMDIDKK